MPPRTRGRRLTRLAGITAVAIFAQMLLGSWVTGHRAGLAYADFPLMDGSARARPGWQRAGGAARASGHEPGRRRPRGLDGRRDPAVATDAICARRLALWLVVLIVVQIALGGLNVVSRLSALFVVPHLAVGAALWGASVWLLLATRRLRPSEVAGTASSARLASPGRPGHGCAPTWRSRSRGSSSCCS